MIAKPAIRACYLLFLLFCSFCSQAQLKSDFSSTPQSGCSPLLVQFTDISTGNPTQWKWDLGNGTTSFLQNPSVTYFDPGDYAIKLVVRTATGADSIVKTKHITVFAKPSVNFISNVTAGCYPLLVKFTDQSNALSGDISSWQWDFGDGTGSDEKDPQHEYTASGNFNVTLRVSNSKGCITTLAKPAYIKISNGVTANFTNVIPDGCRLPVTANFTNTSTGTGSLTYLWDLGDGATSTDESPSHAYTSIGSYTIKLIVKNSNGCTDTIIKPNAIVVGSAKASFTSNSNFACIGNGFNLKITSSTPTSVKWDFADGTTSTEINPTKIYTIPGIYRIKLIENFGGCSDSTFKTVSVTDKPVAEFSSGNTISCKSPLTVDFNNLSTGASTYKWFFGDGDSSNLLNPSHTYTTGGIFDVTLIVSNTSGCSNLIKKIGLVQIVKPKLKVLNLPDSGCLPFAKSFSYATEEVDIWKNVKWSFGDGGTSTEVSPSYIYNSVGLYTVTLTAQTVEGCTDTAVIKDAINVTTKPSVAFEGDREACAIIPIKFKDKSTGNITKWFWEFGDGATSPLQNPDHQYSDTGFFTVRLTVWNGGCLDSVSIKDYVYIKAPIAKFDVPVNCIESLERTFTDKSIGADTWNWDFGDGITSIEQNPVHRYDKIGIYTVTLVVHNNITGCDFKTTKEVQIVKSRANFYASDTIICRNSSIEFTVPINDKVFNTAYDWSFGDGTSATTATGQASHVYKQSGIYDVRLIATNILGCKDTLSKLQYIRVDGPTAKFVPAIPATCLQTSIAFTDNSSDDGTHPIKTWMWNYGDGNKDTLTSGAPTHTYSKAGSYVVTLKVIDSKGCTDSFTIQQPVIISQPIADFSSKDTLSCPGKPIQFTTQAVGNKLSFNWDFGDITTATTANPSHLYSMDGAYPVKLLVTDIYGCKDSITKPSFIKIVTPKSDFSMSDSLSTCPPLVVSFKDISNVGIARKWDFGDSTYSTLSTPSHFYNYPGTYIVKLTITGPGGCIDVKEKPIVIRGPRGAFTYNPLIGCKDLKIDFIATTQDKASFIWDYSDGKTVSTTDSIISHTYTFYGEYVPKLILVDPAGCHVPIVGDDTIKVNGAQAKFNFTNKVMCDSGFVSFTDSSDSYDKIVKYTWDLGDGISSNDQNTTHQYLTAGTYYPKLIVNTVNGCSDTTASPAPIKVVASPQISNIKFNNGCVPLSTSFSGDLLVPDTSILKWQWDFGNGNVSDTKIPPIQNYSVAGNYNINLTVTNSSGCYDTAIRKVEAYAIPVVDAGADAWVCIGKTHTMNASGTDGYSWKLDNSLSCLNCANPVAKPTADTKYLVTGISIHGCKASDSVALKVQQPQKIAYSKTDTLCQGTSVKLFANGSDNYKWIPATGLSDPSSANPTANPATTTTYQVIGTDARSCFSDTGFIRIKVYPIPVVEAGENKVVNIGKTVTIKPSVSEDVTQVIWTPQTWVISSRNDLPNLTVKPKETTQYNIEVKNPGGCTSTDNITIFVICDDANIFMPNTFSPNADGANDVYYPRGTGLFSIKGLHIFNRWGEIVYERNNFKANDASAAWDGTYKGTKLTPDVYVYTLDVICDNNEVISFKGNIALIQ